MSARAEDLEPITHGLYLELFARWAAEGGAPIRLTYTLRSMDEQLHLWQQGRKFVNGVWVVVLPKLVVTNAMPGQSPHNYGAAFDVCFAGADPYLHAYEQDHATSDPVWARLGQAGRGAGLVWGGDFHSLKDRPHFERPDWRSLRAA